jgi:hypothetical protein
MPETFHEVRTRDHRERRVEASHPARPDEPPQAIAAWMNQQAQAGTLVGGEAFETESTPPATLRKDRRRDRFGIPEALRRHRGNLGAYALIEASTLDEAIKIASSWPTPVTLEVRPIWSET